MQRVYNKARLPIFILTMDNGDYFMYPTPNAQPYAMVGCCENLEVTETVCGNRSVTTFTDTLR